MQSNNILTHKKTITTTANDNNTSIPHRRTPTTQACAACKYQRRKCAADCILSPYFPHDRQRQFLNAHRLFGVSNIVKILRRVEPPEINAAMRTIIFQSESRAADPVGGCYRIIRDLEHQISLATAELEIVLHHLALCRAACHQEQAAPPLPQADLRDSKWRGEYVDDVNSWSFMDGINGHGHGYAHAESSSSSCHHHSTDECNHDMKIILDQLSRDYDEEYKFESHDNILQSDNAILTVENASSTEEDGPFYVYSRSK